MAKGHGSSQYHKNSQNAKYAKQVKLKLSNKEERFCFCKVIAFKSFYHLYEL